MPIDKETLYGDFRNGQTRRERIHERAICKALDLPVDDDVKITNTTNGMSAKGLAIVVVAMLAAWWGNQWMNRPAPQIQSTPPPAVAPVDSSYTVLHYNKDGELINVPQRKPTP